MARVETSPVGRAVSGTIRPFFNQALNAADSHSIRRIFDSGCLRAILAALRRPRPFQVGPLWRGTSAAFSASGTPSVHGANRAAAMACAIWTGGFRLGLHVDFAVRTYWRRRFASLRFESCQDKCNWPRFADILRAPPGKQQDRRGEEAKGERRAGHPAPSECRCKSMRTARRSLRIDSSGVSPIPFFCRRDRKRRGFMQIFRVRRAIFHCSEKFLVLSKCIRMHR